MVRSGRYQNASGVLRDGLRLVEAREADEAARLQALRDAARVGEADLEAGRYREVEDPEALVSHVRALMDRARHLTPQSDDA